jgi:hypothetical protein
VTAVAPRTERPHGRVKYVVEKCRCETCTIASREYNQWLRRQHAYGRPPTVDAAPARAHVRALGAAGIGWRRVAKVAGVHSSIVSKLLYGTPTRNMAPTKRLRPDMASKILAVSVDAISDGALVPSAGTRRRIQALVAIGWSMAKLADRLGVQPTNLPAVLNRPNVLVATRRAVVSLYDELWDTAPPTDAHRDKIAASRARNMARRNGWPPPMAWDDDEIDDPRPTLAERPAIVRRMVNDGAGVLAIARAIRADRLTVHKLLEAS